MAFDFIGLVRRLGRYVVALALVALAIASLVAMIEQGERVLGAIGLVCGFGSAALVAFGDLS